MLYFLLPEERNKWKLFSHTPLGPGPEGLFFESHAQCCLSVAVSLMYIFEAQFPPNPSLELITHNVTYTLLVRYSLLGLSAWSLTKRVTVV